MIEAISAVAIDVTDGVSGAAPALSSGRGQAQLFDVTQFEAALQNSEAAGAPQLAAPVDGSDANGFRAVLENLDSLNGRVDLLSDSALDYASGAREFTPGDMLEMTVRCHQFLFQCELTTNVANRSSDGIQQLFRQQS